MAIEQAERSGPLRIRLPLTWIRVALPLLALASCAVYLVAFTLPMWLPRYYDLPHLDAPKILGVSTAARDRFSLAIIVLFALYLTAFRASHRLRSERAAVGVLAMAALLCLSALPMYPGTAGDLFAYIAEADVVLKYHANPFLVPVLAFSDHPLLPYVDFPGETTHYGPLWLVIGMALRLLGGSNLLVTVLVFKAAAALFLLATAWVVYLTVRTTRPEAAVPGAVLVAWNPLLVFELAGNGHNDVAMMLFVALAFYLYQRRSLRLAVTALLAAGLVKYVAFALLPLFLVAMLRGAGRPRTWLPGAGAYALGAGIVAVALVSVVGIQGTLGVLDKQSRWFTTSASSVAYLWLARPMGAEAAARAVSRGGEALFAIVYLLLLYRTWRRPQELAAISLWAILAFLLLAVSWFQPWYVTWVLPLAAIAATPTSYAAAMGLSLGAFLTYSVMGFEWRLTYGRVSIIRMHAVGAATAWLPGAVAAALAAVRSVGPWKRGLGEGGVKAEAPGPALLAPRVDPERGAGL